MAAKTLMLPANRAFNSNGFPEAGATATLYVTGTTTPANFYSDSGLTTSLGSTITANAAGRFTPLPYQEESTAFRLVIQDAEGNTLDDIDPFYFGTAALQSASTLNVASSATNTLFVRSSTVFGNIADGTTFYSALPGFTSTKPIELICSTLLVEPTTKIAINPTAASYAQGVVVNQSTATTGSTAGPFDFNSIDVNIRSTATGSGLPGEEGNAAWNAFRVTAYVGGAGFDADQTSGIAGAVIANQASTSESDLTGVNGGAFVDNVSYGGNLYGGCVAATVADAGGSSRQVMGLESGVSIREGGTSPLRSAINCANYGDDTATDIDTAISVMCAGPTGFGSGAFENLIYFIDPTPGVPMPDDPLNETRRPMQATGSFFKSNVAFTVANVFDLSNVTVTGNILDFPNLQLSGDAEFTLGNGVPTAGMGIGAAVDVNAFLSFGASTATKYAMIFATGAEPTTIRANGFWFDGSDLYFRDSGGNKFKLNKTAV